GRGALEQREAGGLAQRQPVARGIERPARLRRHQPERVEAVQHAAAQGVHAADQRRVHDPGVDQPRRLREHLGAGRARGGHGDAGAAQPGRGLHEAAQRMRCVHLRPLQVGREGAASSARVRFLGGADARGRGAEHDRDPCGAVAPACRVDRLEQAVLLQRQPRQAVVAALPLRQCRRQRRVLDALHAADPGRQRGVAEIVAAQPPAPRPQRRQLRSAPGTERGGGSVGADRQRRHRMRRRRWRHAGLRGLDCREYSQRPGGRRREEATNSTVGAPRPGLASGAGDARSASRGNQMHHTKTMLAGALLAAATLLPSPAAAQGKVLTDADYARAERFVGYNTVPLVDHMVTRVTWLGDDHFWYRDHDAGGDSFRVVDAATGQAGFAFDRDRLAAALGKATGKPVKADKLPVTGFSIRDDGGFEIDLRGTRYLCDADAGGCTEVARKGGEEPGVRSPDGKSEAFIRDWNLWVRDVATGEETQLTTDGSTDYGYATDNAGWTHSDRAILVWSPDSSKIATFQQDQRRTGEMVLVKTVVGHPEVERWKYPLVREN